MGERDRLDGYLEALVDQKVMAKPIDGLVEMAIREAVQAAFEPHAEQTTIGGGVCAVCFHRHPIEPPQTEYDKLSHVLVQVLKVAGPVTVPPNVVVAMDYGREYPKASQRGDSVTYSVGTRG